MERKAIFNRHFVAIVIFASLSAGTTLGAQPMDTVSLRDDGMGGSYLVDARGMTLYYYTKDNEGGSVCNGNCLKAWPAFYSPTIMVSPPLAPSDFSAITRDDGSMQTTYRGWPLYYWVRDQKPGDETGEGVGKVWYVLKAPPYSVMLATDAKLGDYLVDGAGRSLYWFTKDQPAAGNVAGAPNANWPAFSPADFILPSALRAGDFSTVIRDDGSRQAAFRGYPLYYFAGDSKRGDLVGQGKGGVWFAVDPANFPPPR